MTRLFRLVTVAVATAALFGAGCADSDDPGDTAADAGSGGALEGVLAVTAGECPGDGAPTGSYFRMVEPGGTPEDGPFVENGDSPCADKTYTPLHPGSDGGLRLGAHQEGGDPAFEGGNSQWGAIVAPTAWYAVNFGVATGPTDPQTGASVPPPSIEVSDGRITGGDLSAFAAAWNDQHFNQGAPKPGGERPGNTSGPVGEYDADSGAMTVEWTSQIEGGPFHNFTGIWRLEGTLQAA